MTDASKFESIELWGGSDESTLMSLKVLPDGPLRRVEVEISAPGLSVSFDLDQYQTEKLAGTLLGFATLMEDGKRCR